MTLPTRELVDWKHARSLMKPEIPCHQFLEGLVMGSQRRVFTHLILPTCMSVMIDADRNVEFALKIAREKVYSDVLIHQHNITVSCIVCGCPLVTHSQKPYQMAIRIIGATDKKENKWTYDFLLALFCHVCNTRPWRSLLLVKESIYVELSVAISEHGFNHTLDVGQFMDFEKYGYEDTFYVTSMALLDSYLTRFICINKKTTMILQQLQTNEYDLPVCYHCKRATHSLVQCDDCKVVSFCNDVSPDKRLGRDRTCLELGRIYHKPACEEIRKGYIFDVENSYFVNRKKRNFTLEVNVLPLIVFFF